MDKHLEYGVPFCTDLTLLEALVEEREPILLRLQALGKEWESLIALDKEIVRKMNSITK